MPIFSRLIFTIVRWSARRGLRDCSLEPASQKQNQEAQRDEKFERKEKARRSGLLGETYGYWFLRKQGYIFIAKNYMPQGAKGELDLCRIRRRDDCLCGTERARCATTASLGCRS
jgi:hypothetical protein